METPEERLVNGSIKKELTREEWLEGAIKSMEALMQEHEHEPDSEIYQKAREAYLEFKKELRADRDAVDKSYKNRAEVEEIRGRNKFSWKKWGMGVIGDMIRGFGYTLLDAYGYNGPSKLASMISSVKRSKDKE